MNPEREFWGSFSTNPKITSPQPPDTFNSLLQKFLNHFGCEKVCWSFLANIEVETSTRNNLDQVSVAISSIVESTKFGKSEQRNKVGPAEHRNRVRHWESRVMRLWTFDINKLRKSNCVKTPVVLFYSFFCMDQKTFVSTRSASRKRVVDM